MSGGKMITENTTIEEVLAKYPGANKVFLKYGLDCAGCQVAEYESIGHACKVYGIKLDALLKELNEMEK
jgi:hybrid cluster-associated redox disulfide protein